MVLVGRGRLKCSQIYCWNQEGLEVTVKVVYFRRRTNRCVAYIYGDNTSRILGICAGVLKNIKSPEFNLKKKVWNNLMWYLKKQYLSMLYFCRLYFSMVFNIIQPNLKYILFRLNVQPLVVGLVIFLNMV